MRLPPEFGADDNPKKGVEVSNAVTKKDKSLPSKDLLATMRGDEGAGMENMTTDDYAIPFVKLLQDLSPQVKKRDPSYIEGAEPGDFYNTVTGEIVSGEVGMRVIPVSFRKVFNEWVPRKEGGGFVMSHPTEMAAVENADEANEVIETAMIFALVEDSNGNWNQAVFSLTSTKLSVARKWNSLARMRKIDDGEGGTFTPPYFGVVYRMRSIPVSNEKGEFFNLRVEDTGDLTLELDGGMDLYRNARDFLDLLRADRVGADFNKASEEETLSDDF